MEEPRHGADRQFEQMFVRVMSFHHWVAIEMTNGELARSSADLGLRLMADAIRHEQVGEIH